jgi:ATP-dependent protease HslVU (ClpYQ) ATPase subunit
MRTITIKVNNQTADFVDAMDESRLTQLSKKIEEFITGETKFFKAVRKLQNEAKMNGLTEEKLQELLKEG